MQQIIRLSFSSDAPHANLNSKQRCYSPPANISLHVHVCRYLFGLFISSCHGSPLDQGLDVLWFWYESPRFHVLDLKPMESHSHSGLKARLPHFHCWIYHVHLYNQVMRYKFQFRLHYILSWQISYWSRVWCNLLLLYRICYSRLSVFFVVFGVHIYVVRGVHNGANFPWLNFGVSGEICSGEPRTLVSTSDC